MKQALAVSLLCMGAAFGAVLEPYGLECEARRDPVGIDLERPRLGWKLKSGEQDQRQTAYQILVASSRDTLAAGALGFRACEQRADHLDSLWRRPNREKGNSPVFGPAKPGGNLNGLSPQRSGAVVTQATGWRS